MNAIRNWMVRNPVLAFVLLSYGFSWGLWAFMICVWGTIHWLGSFGPSVAALVVVAITQGRAGLKNLWHRILAGRLGVGWYLFITLGAFLILLLGLLLYLLLGGVMLLPGEKLGGQLILLPLYYLIVFIIGGPLGEEIGWRGFLLPHFLQNRKPFPASLLVAAIWFGWHMPLFWLPGASQVGTPIGGFAVFLAAWSVLFTWMHLGTRGSLLAALLLHTSINTFSLVMSETDPAHADAPFLAYAAVSALAAIIVIAIDRRRLRGLDASAGTVRASEAR
jgi:membrane protease YdiL (CAAX protease family)